MARKDLGVAPTLASHDVTKGYVDTAVAAKANIASPTFTGTVGGITKAMVGLASVDNTTDVAKPVSTAQAAANATKAAIAGQVFTGAISATNLSGTNTGDQSAITGNAGSATKLLTPRAINGVDFDGTAAITIPVGAHTQLASTITDLGIAPSSVMHFATYGDRSLAIDGASGTRRGMISYCDDVGFLQTVYTDYGAWYALVPDPDPATTTGRLSPGGMNNLVTDWDDALATGWYAGAGAAHAPPFGGSYMGTVEALSVGGATWVTQTLQPFNAGESASDTMMYRRERVAGSWGLWYKLQWSQAEQDARYAPAEVSYIRVRAASDQPFGAGIWTNMVWAQDGAVRGPAGVLGISNGTTYVYAAGLYRVGFQFSAVSGAGATTVRAQILNDGKMRCASWGAVGSGSVEISASADVVLNAGTSVNVSVYNSTGIITIKADSAAYATGYTVTRIS